MWVQAVNKEMVELHTCIARARGEAGAFTSAGFTCSALRNAFMHAAKILGTRVRAVSMGGKAGFGDVKGVLCSWEAGCVYRNKERVGEIVREKLKARWRTMGMGYDRDAFVNGLGVTKEFTKKKKRRMREMERMNWSKAEMSAWKKGERRRWRNDRRERVRQEKVLRMAKGKEDGGDGVKEAAF